MFVLKSTHQRLQIEFDILLAERDRLNTERHIIIEMCTEMKQELLKKNSFIGLLTTMPMIPGVTCDGEYLPRGGVKYTPKFKDRRQYGNRA